MKNILTKFHSLLGFTALLIAFCAAFFSVYGIATLFAGATISVMIMASSLEIGKLVATTFLYRYWMKCSGWLKSYLVISVIILMGITSLGIFGYLSSAYQKSSIEYSILLDQIKNIESQSMFYDNQINDSKKRINDLTKLRLSQESRLSEVLTNEFLTRNPLQLKQLQQQTIDLISQTDKDIKDENQKIQSNINNIQQIKTHVNEIKTSSSNKKDIQTFKFVAEALGVSLDVVARWFIITIIFVFDPLAVCLILAYNVASYKKEKDAPTIENYIPSTEQNTPKVSSSINTDQKIEPSNINTLPTPPASNPAPVSIKNTDDFFNSYFKK